MGDTVRKTGRVTLKEALDILGWKDRRTFFKQPYLNQNAQKDGHKWFISREKLQKYLHDNGF